jgi:HD-GYP domain-containing protein (c-di-GMP phosphodiesterase class II)
LPAGIRGEDIPLYSRIALVSQVIDVFQVSNGPEAARLEVQHRAGTWFDPRIAAAFERAAARPEFWAMLSSAELQNAIFALEPAQQVSFVDEDYLDDIAAAFAQVIDSKSPYTSGHSERVTLFADLIAEQLALSSQRRRWLKRAALLHDIGKLGVSNSILDKPAKLDDGEWAAMQKHSALGETILSRIGAFSDLAFVAGAHHERLDGKGYPRGISGGELPLEVRMVTVADIFDALTADRPYRAAMPVTKALAIMAEMVDKQIDPVCFDALKRALKRVDAALAA